MNNAADSRSSDLTDNEEKEDHKRFNPSKKLESLKISSAGFSSGESDSVSRENGTNMLEKATVLLMKKAPSLTDKELNPEFFQKLEKRSLDDFPVEVVLPRRCLQSSHSQCEEGSEVTCNDSTGTSNCDGAALQESDDTHGYNTANYRNEDKRPGPYKKVQDLNNFARDKWTEQRGSKAKESKAKVLNVEDTTEVCQKDPSPGRTNVPRSDANTDGSFMNNRANWTAIQRQLAQLERQQASLMNMLQVYP